MCSKNILKILTFLSPITNNDGSYKKKQKFKKIIQQHPGPGVPLTYFNDGAGGGGGIRVIFGGLKFWPKVIFYGFMKDTGILLGCKKTEGFFGLQKKD